MVQPVGQSAGRPGGAGGDPSPRVVSSAFSAILAAQRAPTGGRGGPGVPAQAGPLTPGAVRASLFYPSPRRLAPRLQGWPAVGPAGPGLIGASPGGDQVDLSRVEWLDTDVSRWRRTSRITEVDVGDDHISLGHTKAGEWPPLEMGEGPTEGNPWIFVNRGGTWYAGTYEWLAPGQTWKGITAESLAGHTTLKEPLASFVPRPGELVGFMVSAPARSAHRTVEERSNVVLARWPGGTSSDAPAPGDSLALGAPGRIFGPGGPGAASQAGPAGWPGPGGLSSATGLGRPDPLRHKTDFLTMRGRDGQPIFTHLYAGLPPAERAAIRQELKARGYTHLYLYAANEGDYGGRARFDYYDRPAAFRGILRELVADGIAPVVWLAPDDADGFHAANPPSRLKARWSSFVPAIDDLVSSYVPGLEADEYWSAGEQDDLGRHLRSLTRRPIFSHNSAGGWETAKAPWASGVIYQYGFGLGPAEVERRTRELVSRLAPLGKAVIAGEYAYQVGEVEARRLGAAAVRGGAWGVGNGQGPA